MGYKVSGKLILIHILIRSNNFKTSQPQKTTQMRNSLNDDIKQLDANNRKKKGKKSLKS